MRIFGIGIDVVEVPRIAASIESYGEKYLAKIYTVAEREYCQAHKNFAIHYAARFAAKEAVSKAMGTGIGQHAAFLDLEVFHDDAGAPRVRLYGAAYEFAQANGIRHIYISLTHTDSYAAANAIAVCDS
jgi:holo-[acyl-carrier protein] synthase